MELECSEGRVEGERAGTAIACLDASELDLRENGQARVDSLLLRVAPLEARPQDLSEPAGGVYGPLPLPIC